MVQSLMLHNLHLEMLRHGIDIIDKLNGIMFYEKNK